MSQYLRDHWGVDRGFPHAPVYAIGQTADGYLWIGTGAGLVRFDGFSFHMVRDDSGKFAITSVPELAADNDGCLWLRLQDAKLLRYCNGAFETPSSAIEQNVSAMSRTNRGDVMFAQFDKGVYTFRGGGVHLLTSASNLSRTPATALAQTANGDVWIGTRDAGVFRREAGKTSPIANELPHVKINCLVADGEKSVWIGTDGGVMRWNGNQLAVAGTPAFAGHFQALSIARDRDSNVWVGTDSRGLLRYNSQGVAQLNEHGGVSGDAVTAVFEDREGNLWIGSESGLERLSDGAFVTYSLPEGLPTGGNNPVFVDSENRMWFAPVDGGLWWAKDGQHGRVIEAGLDKDVVYSITGRNGELWLGRQHGGLTRLRPDPTGSFTAKTYTEADGLPEDSVYSVYQTRDGSVWAGTVSGGASNLSGGKFTTWSISNGLASNTVSAILETADGTTWFATPNGLSAMSKGRWQTYTRREGLPSVKVNCLLEDSGGVLWIGTDDGLAFGDSRGFRVPAVVPLSLKEQVLGIAEDRFGWLWIATSTHVVRVKRNKLMSGTLADGDIREYGPADGLRGVEGVRRNQSVIADPLGRIWFSLKQGISSVDPARLARPSVPAIVHLLAISADNRAIQPGTSVHIPGGSRRITFGFAGLSLSSPERVRFRYQLDGYDHGWSAPATIPEANYTNLSPGPYRFRVIASNADGVWSLAEATLALEVDPLYWQTSWFRVIVLLVCAFAVAAAYRLRLRQLTTQLNSAFDQRLTERTRIARELHDTLLQGLHGLMFRFQAANNLLPERPGEAKKILESALDGATQAITEARDAVGQMRSSAAVTSDLAAAIAAQGEELAAHRATSDPNADSTDFLVETEGTPRDLHPILRDEIYRIVLEALRNAFRHAGARRVEVRILYEEHQLQVRILDDGGGIAPGVLCHEKRAGHWGLPGMRERSRSIGGEIDIRSEPGNGTEVKLRVPARLIYQSHSFSVFHKNKAVSS
jgi:ligand-binding sensor domain-containing protein/signal transduction histidine kinase